MNTMMWTHPLTARHLETLQSFGACIPGVVTVVQPVCKKLACGDVGVGAMASVADIVRAVDDALQTWRARTPRLGEEDGLRAIEQAAVLHV
jgi:phosphopantothenoylcysteine decarboxylase